VRRWGIAAAFGLPILALGLAAILTLNSAGSMQDEGALLAYADRVLHGAVAHRDFETYYGPGMPWVLAGAFAVAGHHVLVERAVGMLLELVVTLGMVSVGLRFGTRQGVIAGLLSAAVLICVTPPIASPLLAAVALAVVSLRLAAFADLSRSRWPWRYMCAGALAALAITFRIDFAVAVLVSILPLLAGRGRASLWYLAGMAAGLVPLAVHLVIASPGTVVTLITSDAPRALGARRLPLPPTDPAARVELAVLLLAITLDIAAAAVMWRRARASDGTRLVAALALLPLAMLPGILQRADEYHLLPAMIVPVALLALSVPVLVQRGRRPSVRIRPSSLAYVLCAATLAIAVVHTTVQQTPGVAVDNQGRSFPVGAADAGEAQAVLTDVDRIARPGQRLFIGPMDMRRTNYTATYMYFLLPQLVPATYYQEMEPLSANGPGSHLAADVASADVLVLTTKWDDWSEPNQSSTYYGPAAPNQVVEKSFCLRAQQGTFSVFTRCDARG
jgi:hypothetical protein